MILFSSVVPSLSVTLWVAVVPALSSPLYMSSSPASTVPPPSAMAEEAHQPLSSKSCESLNTLYYPFISIFDSEYCMYKFMLFVSILISKLHYIHTMRASRLVEGKTNKIQPSVPFLTGRLSQYFALWLTFTTGLNSLGRTSYLRLRSVRSCKSNRHACCRECTPYTGCFPRITSEGR